MGVGLGGGFGRGVGRGVGGRAWHSRSHLLQQCAKDELIRHAYLD